MENVLCDNVNEQIDTNMRTRKKLGSYNLPKKEVVSVFFVSEKRR